jgi:Ca-dependent carbohydrate-binding module xylan-binding
MMRQCVPVALVALLAVPAAAAEPIKLDLADFKLASAFKGGEDLIKYENDKISFFTNGTATAKLTVPADGDYVIVIEASCDAALKENAKLTLKVGEKAVKENFELTAENQKEYKFDAKLAKGETTLSVAFTNDAYKENEYDRNLHVHGVRVEKK